MTNSYKKSPSTQHGNTNLIIAAVAIFAILIGLYVQTGVNAPKELPEFSKTIILPTPKTIDHTSFTDHQGNRFGKAQFIGKWSLVFFGFTNCPDICPTTLQTLKQVKAKLQTESLWSNYQVIMVSVDPETDNTERLANYVPYFDPEFIGLNADAKATEQFAKQVGILFVKRDNDNNSNYEVDHSASIVLIDPEGRWAGVIGAPHKADSISADLSKLAHFTGKLKTSNKPQSLTNKVITTTSNSINTQADSGQPPLSVSRAWIRPAPPNASAMAAYFEIKNNTDNDINIIDSNSTAFDITMIHNTEIDNGIARMVHMDGLVVPANGSATLAPLGTHMMLMRPEKQLRAGDVVNITLIDDNDNEYEYSIEVRQNPNSQH